MMMVRKTCWIPSFCVLVLLALFGGSEGIEANFRMYISQSELGRIFAGTHNFSAHVPIVYNDTVIATDGLKIDGTNIPLPPIPPQVNDVVFSISTNSQLSYSYRWDEPTALLDNPHLSILNKGHFRINDTSFSVHLPCKAGLTGVAEIFIIWSLTFQDSSKEVETFPVRFRKLCSALTETSLEASTPQPSMATSDLVETQTTSTNEISSTSVASATTSLSAITSQSAVQTALVESTSSSLSVYRSASASSSSLPLSPSSVSELSSSSPVLESEQIPSTSTVDESTSPSTSTADESSSPSTSTVDESSSPSTSTVDESSSLVSSVEPLIESTPVALSPSSTIDLVDKTSSIVPEVFESSSSEIHSPTLQLAPSPSQPAPSLLISSSVPHIPDMLTSTTVPPPITHSPSPSVVPPTSPGGGDYHLFGFDERSIWFFVIIGAIVGGGLLVILLLMIILLAACCIWRRKRSSKKKKDSQKSSGSKWEGPHRAEFISPMTPPSLWTTLHWGNAQGLPDFLHQTVMDYGMNRNMVAIHNTLKTGTYTCILRGRLLADRINQENPANIQLRIKMLAGFTEEGANRKEEVTQFIEQATLTKGLNHNNILRLVGLCAEDGYVPLVLYPYCEHGNMQSFLEKCRLSRMTDGRQMVTTQHQLTFCLQIAEGMLFLYQNGIVHPDLALRNCYMDANFTVKISDGALTSDLYPDLYHKVYGVKRPVRWSALETLTQGICGSKSNVWSFGITCVETFTLGELPYASVRNRNILAHVLMGNRPVRPNNCPSEVYDLLAECWLEMTQYRPGFAELVQRLQHIVKEFTVREAAEIDGIIDDLCQYAGPYISPPTEKKMLAQPYHRKSVSESTISETDLQQDESVFDNETAPRMTNIEQNDNRLMSADSPMPQATNGPVSAFRERHLTSMSTFSNDSTPAHPPPMLTREGSFRRSPLPSPLPTQRTPVPVRVPVPPVPVHSESGLTQSQSVSSGRSSTDVSSTSQKQLLPKEQQEANAEKRKSDPKVGASKNRVSDPFCGMNISLGEDMEDDFLAAFDTVLTKHTK